MLKKELAFAAKGDRRCVWHGIRRPRTSRLQAAANHRIRTKPSASTPRSLPELARGSLMPQRSKPSCNAAAHGSRGARTVARDEILSPRACGLASMGCKASPTPCAKKLAPGGATQPRTVAEDARKAFYRRQPLVVNVEATPQ